MDQIVEFVTSHWYLLIIAGVVLLLMRDSINYGAIWRTVKGLFSKALVVTPAAPSQVTLSEAIDHYNALMAHLTQKGCVEGQKQLGGVWIHLQPTHVEPVVPAVVPAK